MTNQHFDRIEKSTFYSCRTFSVEELVDYIKVLEWQKKQIESRIKGANRAMQENHGFGLVIESEVNR